ncbi:MAG: NUDIX domain-containing protein [Pseudomonadota bacterium]
MSQPSDIQKVCPIVMRGDRRNRSVLAFVHPLAGKQLVKGTIEAGETPHNAAKRELYEESGLKTSKAMRFLGVQPIGLERIPWHFFSYQADALPKTWHHQTLDDHGHVFSFFWHPLSAKLDGGWHQDFHEAMDFVGRHI